MSWHHPLEHKFFKILKSNKLTNGKFILMFSGGMDSVALAEFFRRTVNPEQIKIFHFHHGPTTPEQKDFRDQSRDLVKDYAKRHKIDFCLRTSKSELRSEADCRKARKNAIAEYQKENNLEDYLIVWGHHQQDLLETRLLRLIRGVGTDGFKSMGAINGNNFRPLLEFSKADIRDYVFELELHYLDDPSNKDPRMLRNWIRHKWLSSLEKKRSGSTARMAQSFEVLSQKIENGTLHHSRVSKDKNKSASKINNNGNYAEIPWSQYLILSENEQNRYLAGLFNDLSGPSFTRNHLIETRKQLARGKNGHMFKVAGLVVTVAQDCFRIERGIV